jgi:hypothetical protein
MCNKSIKMVRDMCIFILWKDEWDPAERLTDWLSVQIVSFILLFHFSEHEIYSEWIVNCQVIASCHFLLIEKGTALLQAPLHFRRGREGRLLLKKGPNEVTRKWSLSYFINQMQSSRRDSRPYTFKKWKGMISNFQENFASKYRAGNIKALFEHH